MSCGVCDRPMHIMLLICLLYYALILCHLPYYALNFAHYAPLCFENIIKIDTNGHYGTVVNSIVPSGATVW